MYIYAYDYLIFMILLFCCIFHWFLIMLCDFYDVGECSSAVTNAGNCSRVEGRAMLEIILFV